MKAHGGGLYLTDIKVGGVVDHDGDGAVEPAGDCRRWWLGASVGI